MNNTIKADAKNITDIKNIEPGWVSGFGEYSAEITVSDTVVSVENLTYEYGLDDSGTSLSVCTPREIYAENQTAIQMAAEKVGIELDDDHLQDIMGQLDTQIEAVIDKRYGAKEFLGHMSLTMLEGVQALSIVLMESPKGEAIVGELERIEKEAEIAADMLHETR